MCIKGKLLKICGSVSFLNDVPFFRQIPRRRSVKGSLSCFPLEVRRMTLPARPPLPPPLPPPSSAGGGRRRIVSGVREREWRVWMHTCIFMNRVFDRENCRLTGPKLFIPIHVLLCKKNCPGLAVPKKEKKTFFPWITCFWRTIISHCIFRQKKYLHPRSSNSPPPSSSSISLTVVVGVRLTDSIFPSTFLFPHIYPFPLLCSPVHHSTRKERRRREFVSWLAGFLSVRIELVQISSLNYQMPNWFCQMFFSFFEKFILQWKVCITLALLCLRELSKFWIFFLLQNWWNRWMCTRKTVEEKGKWRLTWVQSPPFLSSLRESP